MRKTLIVALREYTEGVCTKGFLIGIILAPVFMSGGFLAIALLKGRVDVTDKQVAVVDRSSVVASALVEAAQARNEKEIFDQKTGKKVRPAYLVEIVQPGKTPDAQRVELSQRVKNKELAAFVEIGPDVLKPGGASPPPRIAYYAENAAWDDMRQWMGNPINNHLRRLRLAAAGVEEETVEDLFQWVPVEGLGLVARDPDTGKVQEAQPSGKGLAMAVPMIMIMLMFLMIMMGAQPLLHAVLDEKTERIAEVLLGSARPFELMMGKLLGNLGVSLTAAAVYVVGGILVCYYQGWTEYMPYHLLPWFFVYMVAAILTCGAMWMAVGAACNNVQEAQSLAFPVMLPVMIPMFILVPVIKEPLSGFATWLSLFPPFTPLLMLLRQSTPVGIPAWQPWVGLVGVAVFTVLCVWAGGRIFRVGLLMQGQPPRIGDLLRWAVRG
jgi:ABC-2 type transport system permease protein